MERRNATSKFVTRYDEFPKAHIRAGNNPFSRSIDNWKTPHPLIVLSRLKYPIVSTLRNSPKWEVGFERYIYDYERLPPYASGHYVPSGPRSIWTRAQYQIYKEEQALWRRDRDAHRSGGMQELLEKLLKEARDVGQVVGPCSRVLKVEDLHLPGFYDNLYNDGTINMGIEYRTSLGVHQVEPGAATNAENNEVLAVMPTTNATGPLPGPKSVVGTDLGPDNELVSDQSARSGSSMEGDQIRYWQDSSLWAVTVNTDSNDPWEAPSSETSETEDEYDWLWQRGAKIAHDHWPSNWRAILCQRVNEPHITAKVSGSTMSASLDYNGFDCL